MPDLCFKHALYSRKHIIISTHKNRISEQFHACMSIKQVNAIYMYGEHTERDDSRRPGRDTVYMHYTCCNTSCPAICPCPYNTHAVCRCSRARTVTPFTSLFDLPLLKCCFTSTETVGLLGTGARDVHLDCHTATKL